MNGQHAYEKMLNIIYIIFLISKKKVSLLKRGKRAKKFCKHTGEDTKGQYVQENMLNIVIHQAKAIKTTIRYYCTSITRESVEKEVNLSYTAGGNIKCTITLENSLAASNKIKNVLSMTQQSSS